MFNGNCSQQYGAFANKMHNFESKKISNVIHKIFIKGVKTKKI